MYFLIPDTDFLLFLVLLSLLSYKVKAGKEYLLGTFAPFRLIRYIYIFLTTDNKIQSFFNQFTHFSDLNIGRFPCAKLKIYCMTKLINAK